MPPVTSAKKSTKNPLSFELSHKIVREQTEKAEKDRSLAQKAAGGPGALRPSNKGAQGLVLPTKSVEPVPPGEDRYAARLAYEVFIISY